MTDFRPLWPILASARPFSKADTMSAKRFKQL
jgi:hypothetical protein